MNDQKKKQAQTQTKQNLVESLKGVGTQIPQDFLRELFGFPQVTPKVSGEVRAGESLDMQELLSGKAEENKKLKAQLNLERNLAAEERRLAEEKIGKLRVQLQAIITEITKVAAGAKELSDEVAAATIIAPVDPGVYHLNFFEKLLSFVQSFRKKINLAVTWLHSTNKRAEKKNYWARYKKGRGSFLLAPDHYLQRSAG